MKKRALSLIEIMIVIFLITLVTGAIGYNMKGTLDKGKKFSTEQAMEQLEDLLLVCVDEGNPPEKVAKDPKKYLIQSGIAKNPKKLTQDGWGKDFLITLSDEGKFIIESENLNKLKKK